jgi:hypothetical protein
MRYVTTQHRRLMSLIVFCSLWSSSVHAAASCELIDSFQDFMALSERSAASSETRQIEMLNLEYFHKYPDLYVDSVIMAPGPTLDAKALVAMREARRRPDWHDLDQALGRTASAFSNRFSAKFPDFRCDFPIYVTATFGVLDGAGRIVAGRPSMVIGVDTLSAIESTAQLPVFFAHELFHRYHYQAAGFSDDLSEKDLVWRSLWAEGLATYVSVKLNPSNPLADALLLPRDLEARTRPLLSQMAAQLIAALDHVDSRVFAKFFEFGDRGAESAGWPSRAGYYIGYLVAEDLGRRHSLTELAHLKGPKLRWEIGEALEHFVSRPPQIAD